MCHCRMRIARVICGYAMPNEPLPGAHATYSQQYRRCNFRPALSRRLARGCPITSGTGYPLSIDRWRVVSQAGYPLAGGVSWLNANPRSRNISARARRLSL